MGRLFGLILIVLCVWVGIEVYDKGMDHAFGGLFAWFAEPIHPEGDAAHGREKRSGSIAQQVGAKVRSDLERGARRDTAGESDEEDND